MAQARLADDHDRLVRRRDDGRIDDIVLGHIQTHLDIEVRLTHPEALERGGFRPVRHRDGPGP